MADDSSVGTSGVSEGMSTEVLIGSDQPMTIRTLLRFLLGRRDAILQIAGTRGALGFGFVCVLLAGLGREYDGEDLLREPWHLGIPIVASVGSSFLLYVLLCVVSWGRVPSGTGFLKTYRTFLALYWMTAPLAWLYAIPVERFFSAVDATAANLWLLGIVSLWRVLLIVRVINVLFSISIWCVIFPVLLFADGLVLVLVSFLPVPLFALMGGVRLSDSDSLLAGVGFSTFLIGWLSLPIWGLGSLITLYFSDRWRGLPAVPTVPLSRKVWWVPLSLCVILMGVLPWTQQEQRLRSDIERLYAHGDYQQVADLLLRHPQHAFPPHWDPPPVARDFKGAGLIPQLVEVCQRSQSGWIREIYWQKLRDLAELTYRFERRLSEIPPEVFAQFLSLLETQPEGQEFLMRYRRSFKLVLDLEKRTAEEKAHLKRLLETIPEAAPPSQ